MIINEKSHDSGKVGEMLVVIDNSAWPEALTDESWTKKRIEQARTAEHNRGSLVSTVDISVYTIIPAMEA